MGRQWLGRLGKTDIGIVKVTTVWTDGRVYYPLHATPYTPPTTCPAAPTRPSARNRRWPQPSRPAGRRRASAAGRWSSSRPSPTPRDTTCPPWHRRARRGGGRPGRGSPPGRPRAPGWVPTTQSGKVRRTACRQAYAAGLLDPVHTTPARGVSPAARPGTPLRSALRATVTALPAERRAAAVAAEVRHRVAGLLAVRPASVEDDVPMTAQGLGSLHAIELHGALSHNFDVRLPLFGFLQGDITAVTAGILRRLDEG